MVFERDAPNIGNALCQEDLCWSCFDQLIEDTQVQLNSIHSCLMRHVHNEANEAAHRVAKTDILQSLNQVWKEKYILFIQSIVLAHQDVSF